MPKRKILENYKEAIRLQALKNLELERKRLQYIQAEETCSRIIDKIDKLLHILKK